jgi:uncharacterized protein (DUF58 family)
MQTRFVPHQRLLLLTAVLVMPAIGFAAAFPSRVAGFGLVVVLVVLAAAMDAWRGSRKVRFLGVDMPKPQRFGKDRPGRVVVFVSGFQGRSDRVRLGLTWPEVFRDAEDELLVHLPDAANRARVEWPCIAHGRGAFRLGECQLEIESPWRLWRTRRGVPVDCELRVYPNLWRERRRVASLFLPRRTGGTRSQRQLGQGRDFEKLRDYIPGDGWDEIHWKATAKRGRLVTKLFQVERTQEVYVILDSSRLSARVIETFGSREGVPADPHIERYMVAGLLLGFAAQRQGDQFGLVSFSNRITVFLRAAAGRSHFLRCREALHSIGPEDVHPDFGELFTTLRTRLRRRALLVILTALDDPLLSEQFQRGIRLVARQHLVLVSQIASAETRPLFTGAAPRNVTEICRHLAGHSRWQVLRALAANLQKIGVTYSLLPAEQLAAELVSQYVDIKRRQLL